MSNTISNSKTVKPYSAAGSKKTQVTEMFDNIAPKYDLLNRVLSLGIDTIWRRKAVNRLSEVSPGKVLDVATGTADVAIEINKQFRETEIVGIDISKEMVAYGNKKVEKQGLSSHIRLMVGDSENLPFENNSFDAVTVSFGVRNFENLEKGLSEINRVLRKDGKLVVLEFSKPTMFPFKQGFNFYFKNILPLIGKLTSKDPKAYHYLYESVQNFPDGDAFLKVLEKTGYNSNQCTSLNIGICSIYTGRK